MRLDRNINPDGRGKYALINLRKADDQIFSDPTHTEFPTHAVEYGDKGQFFVIKYKDKFAGMALRGYAAAVRAEAIRLGIEDPGCREAEELHEFANEIGAEADAADALPNKQIPD